MWNNSQDNDIIAINNHKTSEELKSSFINSDHQRNIISDLHLPQKLNENKVVSDLLHNQSSIIGSVPTKKSCISKSKKYFAFIISVVCFILFFLVLFLIP